MYPICEGPYFVRRNSRIQENENGKRNTVGRRIHTGSSLIVHEGLEGRLNKVKCMISFMGTCDLTAIIY